MFIKNPEFIKNIRREFNFTHLISLAIFLFLLIYICSLGNEKDTASTLFNTFCGVGFIFSIIYGSYLVSNSMIEEHKQGTWPFMVMSPLSTGKIFIGKICAAPITVWILTLTMIIPTLIYSLHFKLALNQTLAIPPHNIIIPFIVILFAWILFSYSVSLLLSAYTIFTNKDGRNIAILSTLCTLICGLFIGAGAFGAMDAYSRTYKNIEKFRTEEWYGLSIPDIYLIAAIICFIAFWAMIGAYKTLRLTLNFKDKPYAWILFIITSCIFIQGYHHPYRNLTSDIALDLACAFCIITILFLLLSKAPTPLQYQYWWSDYKNKKQSFLASTTPLWMITAILLIPVLIISIIIDPHPYTALIKVIGITLLITRDIIALHILSWQKKFKQIALSASLYIILVYALLPILLGAKPKWPTEFSATYAQWILILLEIAVLAYYLQKLWRNQTKPIAAHNTVLPAQA